MSPREQYEHYMRQRSEMALDIRIKLIECFTEQAERAVRQRNWEAASAFQYCADVTRGYVAKIETGHGPVDTETSESTEAG